MMEKKEFELEEEKLDQVTGGSGDDDWYWGFGSPPTYPNACPRCGGGVYCIPGTPAQGGNLYMCGPCGWESRDWNALVNV